MECPACGDALVTTPIDGMDFHDCLRCKGVWFEGDELRRALDDSDEELDWLAVGLFSTTATSDAGRRRCPRCREPMTTLAYPHSGVRVDVCRADRGVWLDDGEFDRIVASLEHEIDSMTPGAYERTAVHELRELFERGGSKGRELRDLFTIVHLMAMRVAVEHPKLATAVDAAAMGGL